jgi:hypothetical protein
MKENKMPELKKQVKILRPLKAIRQHCLDCSGGSPQEVRLCEMDDCPLYPYRMGHRPGHAAKVGKTSRLSGFLAKKQPSTQSQA